jgi:hypothetical protein
LSWPRPKSTSIPEPGEKNVMDNTEAIWRHVDARRGMFEALSDRI